MPYRIAGIGEILWDLLPEGRQLGGAPANFAYHAQALGADSLVITRIGADALGEETLRRLTTAGIDVQLVQRDPIAPTGTASVQLAPDGQPHFIIHEHVAWDRLEVTPAARQTLSQVHAVCFGTLAQRTAAASTAVQTLVEATPPGTVRVFDLNLRQHYHSPQVIERSLELATVLKLNETELPVLAQQFQFSGPPKDQLTQLLQRFQLDLVALTLGSKGSMLASPRGFSHHPGLPVKVVDTVGAGDAFTAALTLGRLAGWSVDEIQPFANELARHVCAHAGATPPLPPAFAHRFRAS
jgi:fructokinase